MEKLNNFIGKTVVKIEESKKLDRGVKITFNDGSILECAWNNWEGCFYAHNLDIDAHVFSAQKKSTTTTSP